GPRARARHGTHPRVGRGRLRDLPRTLPPPRHAGARHRPQGHRMVSGDCPVRVQASRDPDGLALVAGDGRWSWAALAGDVGSAAGGLRAAGVGPGDKVAVLAANHPATVVLLFALRRLGAALVPLNVRLTPAELRAQHDRVRPRLLLADAERMDVLAGAKSIDGWTRTGAVPVEGGPTDSGADWALLFTSGTTGRPKAARLTV